MLFADLHIHSYLSRATSQQMNIEELSRSAKQKGLGLLGTGDFTHPVWLRELREKLRPLDDSGLFIYDETLWMLTCEVSTVYQQGGKARRIHHVIHAPSFEVVDQIREALSKRGDLAIDGRPIFDGLSSPELVEMLMGISRDVMIIPSHAWTTWWSIFGAFSGFDSVEECYQEQSKHIFAIETGLSSDPPMNWRLSRLDHYCLMSNSDAHSPWIWRLGREFNAFDLKKVSYYEIVDAARKRDGNRFAFTGEVSPEYGKYHFTGHRNCDTSLHPKEAIKLGNRCPRCGRRLTIGVLQRVEELADRPEGFIPKNALPFRHLLPLYEIISHVTGTEALYSKKVMGEQDKLIAKFGNELNILLKATKEELARVIHEKIAEAIIRVREGRVEYVAGYDGVYGKPVFEGLGSEAEEKAPSYRGKQGLDEYV